MAKLRATNIEPQSGTNLTLGASGDAVTIASTETKANTVKDAGGNTLWTSDGSGTLSSINSALVGGGLTLITTQTVTSAASQVNYSTGIDSTYDEYVFISNIYYSSGPAWTDVNFYTDAGTTAANKTTTAFHTYQSETADDKILQYASAEDEANSTNGQKIDNYVGSLANSCSCGIMHLFQPSSSTSYKQIISRQALKRHDVYAAGFMVAGYLLTASPIVYVRYEPNTGTITGTFKMYGVS